MSEVEDAYCKGVVSVLLGSSIGVASDELSFTNGSDGGELAEGAGLVSAEQPVPDPLPKAALGNSTLGLNSEVGGDGDLTGDDRARLLGGREVGVGVNEVDVEGRSTTGQAVEDGGEVIILESVVGGGALDVALGINESGDGDTEVGSAGVDDRHVAH